MFTYLQRARFRLDEIVQVRKVRAAITALVLDPAGEKQKARALDHPEKVGREKSKSIA